MPMNAEMVTDLPRLRPRPWDVHKGQCGKVLLVAGSRGMAGAAILSGSAALRGGAGLVKIASAEVSAIVATAQPCAMTVALPANGEGKADFAAVGVVQSEAEWADVVAIGPGLGRGESVTTLVRAVLTGVDRPMLLDADALNALVGWCGELRLRTAPTLLTPHLGEFARLLGRAVADGEERQQQAIDFAKQRGIVLVLKGPGTIVTDGRRVYRNTTGNPGLATGGSGDVLTGLIAAFLGQGFDAFDAARLGVYLHGRAGDLARDALGEISLLASDLLDYLPSAILAHAAIEVQERGCGRGQLGS